MKKILLSLICIIVLTLTSGCANKEKELKKELDKRYDNYEIIDSSHYWNTGGENYVDGIVKINNNLYEIIVDMSGETNEYYESLAEEVDLNIDINNKNYSSNNNLILMKLSFNDPYTINEPMLLLFIENDRTLEFYDNLYKLIEKLDYEYLLDDGYPYVAIYFTDNINFEKKYDYKKYMLLNMLAWEDTKLTKKLYEDLKVNNYIKLTEGFRDDYSDWHLRRSNYTKQVITDLKKSYELGMLYDDYVYEKEMSNY